ncbi:ESPR-type extended signal peptide-containing protein [Dyella subtropica]|uniref:ESPR-type extended signal peptide-containing protein n=1 Tax=Dyella subtropica TaxID=2992127 RepID=UPI002255FBCB|nr:ESPR-type extended signal peptide-containing protein [Dyella subtropica]
MNTIYRLVWNNAIGKFVVASELAKGRKKKSGRKALAGAMAIALVASAPFGAAFAADTTSTTCTTPNGQSGTLDAAGECTTNTAGSLTSVSSANNSPSMGIMDIGILAANDYAAGGAVITSPGVGPLLSGRNTAIGVDASIGGPDSVAVGSATAVGANALVTGSWGAAYGVYSTATNYGDAAIGAYATATGGNALSGTDAAVALGAQAKASAASSVAIGAGAAASATNSVALGAHSTTGTRANVVSVGAAGNTRQIINMAAGTAATDAVNVSQLTPVVDALGGGAKVDATTGAVTGPSYTIQGTTQTIVGGALTSLNTAVTNNTTNITTLTNNLNSGTVGLVQQASAGANITVAAGKGGTAVDFAGTNGARTLKSVAIGALSATSTEAVNGSQLFATNQNVTNNTNAITALDGRVTTNTTNITALQQQIGDVSAGGVQYDDAIAKDKVTLGGTGAAAKAVTLTNVADGSLSATSTDAVNGSQLYNTNQRVSVVEGDITTINTNLSNLGDRVTVNEGNISTITNQLGELSSGTIGIVKQDAASGVISVGAGLGGTVVDLGGSSGPRVLSGIANGVADTDAVSIAQLRAAGALDPVSGEVLSVLTYDGHDLSRATLGGTNGSIIGNLAGGAIAYGSMEAVNGGQMYDMRQMLQGQIDSLDGRVGSIEQGVEDGTIGGGGDGPVSDNGGAPIHNVGDGVAASDAANVGQVTTQVNEAIETAKNYTDTKFDSLNQSLTDFRGEVNDRFRRVDGKIDQMGAISAANTQMAINAAGASKSGRVAMGVGFQNGKKAMAVGYAQQVGERTRFSLGGAFGGSENSVGAGIGVDL